MRQHFQPVQSTQLSAEALLLSVEEEAIATSETAQHLTEADLNVEQALQLGDISNVVEDTVLVVDMVPKIGEPETDLLNAVADMAVAGSDMDGADILPLSANVDGVVSTESIGETLSNIWEKICAFVNKMWKHLTDFFDNLFNGADRLKKRVAAQLSAAKTLGDQEKGLFSFDSAKVKSYRGAFSLDGKVMKVEQLRPEFERLMKFANTAYKEAPGHVLEAGHVIEKMFKAFDPSSADGGNLTSLGDELVPIALKYVKAFTDSSHKRDEGNSVVQSSGPMVGNFSVEVSIPKDLQQAHEGIEAFVALSKIRASVVTRQGDNETKATFAIPPVRALVEMLQEIDKTLDSILDFKSGGVATKLKDQNEAIRKAADATLAKLKTGGSKETTALVRRMLPLNVMYANWAKEPMTGLVHQVVKILAADVNMAEDAFASYREPGRAFKGLFKH